MGEPFVALDFPSWIQWGVRRGAILPYLQERGANGRGLCRWCRVEVPKGSQSWCSKRCVDQFLRVSSWGALSQYIIERDGVCQKCGTDHPGWNRARSLERHVYVSARYSWASPKQELIEHGFRADHHVLSEWWEVDHITPVKDGGTDDPTTHPICACSVTPATSSRALNSAALARLASRPSSTSAVPHDSLISETPDGR